MGGGWDLFEASHEELLIKAEGCYCAKWRHVSLTASAVDHYFCDSHLKKIIIMIITR